MNANLFFIDHALRINDVRIAIMQSAQMAGYRIEKWIDDTELKSNEMKDYVSVALHGGIVKAPVIPDAYFVLNLGDRKAHFFLELDRATVSHKRWKTRILAYRAYTETGKYQRRYQTRSLRILTVTTTPERLANLKKTTEEAGGTTPFWFTTIEAVIQNKIFSSAIWHVAGESQMQPLISHFVSNS